MPVEGVEMAALICVTLLPRFVEVARGPWQMEQFAE
jgi:hypothetical protein